MQCPKGDLDGNLARHRALMEQAAESGCALVAFPEMSLTGYLDLETQIRLARDERSPEVTTLVEASGVTGVAALFGIVERGWPKPFITQVLAREGEICGWYRKRHLGEGEDGFGTGSSGGLYAVQGERFTVAICAEAGSWPPFVEAAEGGAGVVLCCAAPGLYGPRRVTDAEWQAGFDWWRTCATEDLALRATRLALWIGVSTQAGATIDEDFPGWAAVIGPDGSVHTELPDWREGTIVADLPPPRSAPS
jgi:predicted amidohydrolase